MDINGKHHDGLLNLIMLEGYTKPNGIKPAMGVHANHDKYNTALINFFNDRWNTHIDNFKNEERAMKQFGREVIKVQSELQKLLLEKCVIGHIDTNGKWIRTKVDDLITEDILESML